MWDECCHSVKGLCTQLVVVMKLRFSQRSPSPHECALRWGERLLPPRSELEKPGYGTISKPEWSRWCDIFFPFGWLNWLFIFYHLRKTLPNFEVQFSKLEIFYSIAFCLLSNRSNFINKSKYWFIKISLQLVCNSVGIF